MEVPKNMRHYSVSRDRLKIMKSIKFKCLKCEKILTLNENGKGQGTHSRVCESNVITKCKCGEEFTGQFTGVYASVRQHVENECF